MKRNPLHRESHESARIRITFFDQDPSGGQKVISGSCYEHFLEQELETFNSTSTNLKNKIFGLKDGEYNKTFQ